MSGGCHKVGGSYCGVELVQPPFCSWCAGAAASCSLVFGFDSAGVCLVPQLEVPIDVGRVEVAGELAWGGKPLPRGGWGVPAVMQSVETSEVAHSFLLLLLRPLLL